MTWSAFLALAPQIVADAFDLFQRVLLLVPWSPPLPPMRGMALHGAVLDLDDLFQEA